MCYDFPTFCGHLASSPIAEHCLEVFCDPLYPAVVFTVTPLCDV